MLVSLHHLHAGGDLVEINSGGSVLFCFFSVSDHSAIKTLGSLVTPLPERCLVVKAHATRLAVQSEQFANELTQHLGVAAPVCRIMRKQVGGSCCANPALASAPPTPRLHFYICIYFSNGGFVWSQANFKNAVF